jgi:glyoxylase-like metal-dependent hydrolase (beta-lactamase superfamily II)
MGVEMRIEMLNVGWMTAAVGIWRQGEEEPERPIRLPVPAYLIETESERILIDTGLHPAAVADAEAHYGPGPIAFFGLEQEASIAEQVDLDTLTRVVLTHLHFDHAGALALIPDSVPVVVQRAEWEGGQDRAAIERSFFLPRDYADPPSNLVLVDGDHDLLGDGSIELLSTPGHTPGHQSLRIGDLVIGADVALWAETLDDGRLPSFGDDFEAQARSLERLRELRDAGLTVRPGHDPDMLRPGPLSA